jgi:hypothetical protein
MLPLPSVEVVASEFGTIFQTFSARAQVISHENAEVLNSAVTQVVGFVLAHPLQFAEVGVVSGLLFMDRMLRGQNQEANNRRMRELNIKMNALDVRMPSKSINGLSSAELAEALQSVQRMVEAEQRRRANDNCLLERIEQLQNMFDVLKSENMRLSEQLLGMKSGTESVPAPKSAATAASAEVSAVLSEAAEDMSRPAVALVAPAAAAHGTAHTAPSEEMAAPPALLRGLSALARSTQYTLRSALQVNLKASVQRTVQQLSQRVITILAEWRGRSLGAVLAVVAAVAGRGLAAKGLERMQQALAEAMEQRRGGGSADEEGGAEGVEGGFRYLDSRAEVFA